MALKVRFSEQAIENIDSIQEYIAARSPAAAVRVRARLLAVIEGLADLPLIGRETDHPRVRVAQLTRYPYRVFYAFDTTSLIILHIRHVAQQTPNLDDLV